MLTARKTEQEELSGGLSISPHKESERGDTAGRRGWETHLELNSFHLDLMFVWGGF